MEYLWIALPNTVVKPLLLVRYDSFSTCRASFLSPTDTEWKIKDDEEETMTSRHYTDIVLGLDFQPVLSLFVERVLHP